MACGAVKTANVSEEAASLAGRIYRNGKLIEVEHLAPTRSGKPVGDAAADAAKQVGKSAARPVGVVPRTALPPMVVKSANVAKTAVGAIGRIAEKLMPPFILAKAIYDSYYTDYTEDEALIGPHTDAFIESIVDSITPTGLPERRTRAELGLDQEASDPEMPGGLNAVEITEDSKPLPGFELPEGDLETPEINITP